MVLFLNKTPSNSEACFNLIKKVLKKEIWKRLKNAKPQEKDDWQFIKTGLVIYFSNEKNWSKETYRLFKDYIPSDVREEMTKESDGEISKMVS